MYKNVLSMSAITVILLVGCSTGESNPTNVIKKETHTIKFTEVEVPETDAKKRNIIASDEITINGKSYPLNFHTILRSGEKVGNNTFGLLYDKNGNPLKENDGSLKISNSNDFTSLLPIGNKIFMINHFESRPGAMYLSELEQDRNGNLEAISTKNIDFASVNGLWVPCAGSISPWNTHLGSEEYEPNAANVKEDGSINSYYNAMATYFEGNLSVLNPYDYGWTTEVKVLNENADVKIEKHYAMGRFAHELAYVMPDNKTVFLSDDGTNVSLFMFIADKEKDLSSGTLYASKWFQKDDKNGGKAILSWVNLGHATNDEIKKALDDKITFNDIFETSNQEDDEYLSINTSDGHENLKIKDGMKKIASRLETRRLAALYGATTEFRKMEGITYNPNKNTIYLAMSSIGKGMENYKKYGQSYAKYDLGGNNDIKLPYNPCGTVYELGMNSNKSYDLSGKSINSKYVPNLMTGLVSGTPDKSGYENKCSVSSLANPDNITFIPNSSTLLIGEDSGSGHQNDYIWSYNTDTKDLTRILTSPYGSETTSLYYINNLKNHDYIMTTIQHPYGESDAITDGDDMSSIAENKNQLRGYTGYMGPLPVINK